MNTTVDKSADKLVTNWIKDSSILLVKFRARLETSIANLASFLWLEKLELIRAESWEKNCSGAQRGITWRDKNQSA